jgi:hypothetical protein
MTMTQEMPAAAAATFVLCSLVSAAAALQDPAAGGGVDDRVAVRMLEAADEVAREVEELRGWKFKHPVRKDVRTEAQLRAYIEKKLFEEEYGGGRLARTEAWLKLLGLMPQDASFAGTIMDVLISQIGGFYDPDEKAFFMMAEASRFGDTVSRMLIAHELCHALDDQHVSLGPLMKGKAGEPLTEDESFTIGGLVEGSATALMFAWMQQKMRAGGVDMAQMMELQKAEAERNKVLLEAPRYFTLIVANYMVGQHFITKGKPAVGGVAGADTGAAIRDAALHPPRSTEQLLHPDKYWEAARRDEPVRLANDDALAARIASDCGAAVLERNTLGELVCALIAGGDRKLNLVLVAKASYWTNKYARGWGGDRLYVVGAQEGDGPVAGAGAVWVTAWDTAEDRAEFTAGARNARGDLRMRIAEGGRVAVFGFGECADDRVDLEAVRELARFVQDGAPWDATGR